MSHDPAVGTNKILQFVIKASTDPDPQVSKYAFDFLARISPAALTNSAAR